VDLSRRAATLAPFGPLRESLLARPDPGKRPVSGHTYCGAITRARSTARMKMEGRVALDRFLAR
jgi:hypothetical protein